MSYTRKYRRHNPYQEKIGKIANNRIHRRFYTSTYHKKIIIEATKLKYFNPPDQSGAIREKKLYLDPFLDMYNSEIISYRIPDKPNTLAVITVLEESIQVTKDCIYRRTFHSDQR